MAEIDIRPYFGSYLEDAVEQFTPAFARRGVHCDYLTIDENGTVRGKVVADYGEENPLPFGPNWIWEADVTVHFNSYFANAATSTVVVDVGQIHGLVDTEAIKNAVVDVLRGHSAEIGAHRPSAEAPAFFFIVNEFTGKVMDLAAIEGNPNGADVRGWSYNGQTNQQWAFELVAEGIYRIRNVWSGKYLDNALVQGNPNGANIYIWENNGQGNQHWRYEALGNQRFRIRNSWTGKYADMAIVAGNPDGADIYGWDLNNQANQIWRLSQVQAQV